MRKFLTAAASVAVLAVPFAAGAQGGVEAEGWEHRLDFGGDVNDLLHFTTMGDGVHATTTGAGFAIFWQPESMAGGDFSISATFTQMERSGHANAYGMFLGGADLDADGQRYTYFMLRQGGEFLIKRRMGEELPTLVDWTAHDAVNDLDANGSSTNTLTVEAAGDTVRFLVNGAEVSSQPRSDVDTDGITGLRVTHMLNMHIGDLDLSN
ncbi:MAG: hypothetical protein OXG35_18630 [Acidobacteria bacterium]|nr:hypothetical protein [Acidobacteriota bacterium]